MERKPPRDRIRKLVGREPESELTDEEIPAWMAKEATTPRAVAQLLDELGDDPLFVLQIFDEFRVRGRDWPGLLKGQLADALEECGFEDEAQVVRDG